MRTSRWLEFVLGSLLFVIPGAVGSTAAQTIPTSLYQGLSWRLVGPFRGGRVLAVAGIPGNANTYYFGSVAGGVWKTTDGGLNWNPLFDHERVSSIGAIAVAPSDPNIVYVGTGEACIRGDSSFGDGVYKSVDGGKSWTHVGLDDTRHIARIIVDPHDPNIVFVAALGHTYGSNTERGVFRSGDGGKTWQKVLYKSDEAGAIDVTFAPTNPHILYAALWEVYRTPWTLVSGGPGSGIYKSIDGGTTWTHLQGHGLPNGVMGRVGISVSGADSERVYAMIEAENGGLYRSDDGGGNWTLINGDYDLRGRPWYYTHVFADPQNADTVYVFNFVAIRSTDGGKSFQPIFTPHGDYHDLWIDPANPQRMIVGNDGGATISTDGGKNWSAEDNQPTGQFYHVAADNEFFYHIYGSQQDRGTVGIATRTDHGGIGDSDWYSVAGGESGFILPSPLDPNIVYAGSLYSTFTRFDRRTGQTKNISPWPVSLLNQPAADAKYRFGWTAPMEISPSDPHTLYVGAQMLLKTSDDGMTWSEISPDLTRNDKSKQQSAGGPITQDNTTVEYYDQISFISESPVQKGVIWAGSDDGLIHVTKDGGTSWGEVTPSQSPNWCMVSTVFASPEDASNAYAAVDCHRLDDFRPYIFKTADFGKTWSEIVGDLPDGSYVHVVKEDPKRKGLLYAGTETGVFVSFDDGMHWQSLQLNLPTSPVYDLMVHDDDLCVATHGRAFWILDDIGALRQASAEVAQSAAFLFSPRIAYRTNLGNVFTGGPSSASAQNPPEGAIIDYFIGGTGAPGKMTLEILDSRGALVRTYVNPGHPHRGMNRFVWNLHYPGAENPEGSDSDLGTIDGPVAVPGQYQVRLTVGGKSETQPLEVKLDPRINVSAEDLQKQFDQGTRARAELSKASKGVRQMRNVRAQLAALSKQLANNAQAKDVVAKVNAVDKQIESLEESITGWKVEPNRYSLNYPPATDDKLTMLSFYSGGADGSPNQPSEQVLQMLGGEIDEALSKWDTLQKQDLAALNDMIRKQNIPVISPPAEKPGSGSTIQQ
jgi:photosystem II stability/assembly factor-like uncharacterized protein